MQQAQKQFRLTGWHVLGIFGCAFAVIIGVNVALAVNAVRSFPGLETANSYVASQSFDARRAAQEALGWQVRAMIHTDRITLSIIDAQGRPVQAGMLDARIGRPTSVAQDIYPEWAFNGKSYEAYHVLEPGNWDVWVKATALDGTRFEQRLQARITDQ